MSKHFAVVAALVAACGSAGAASAQAETTLSAGVKMSPGTAGTHARPQGQKLTFGYDLTTSNGADLPVVTGFEVWHGPGVSFDRGKGYAECSLATLSKMGPDGCPPKSKVGSGSPFEPEDPVEASPKVQIFNGPGRLPLAYVTLQRPARVRAVAPFTMVHRARSAWPHRMLWTIPESMRVVAGVPITFSHLKFTYGYTRAAKLYVSTESCPGGGWRWRVRVHTDRTPVLTQDGRIPCKPAA